jgi:hypothetical protein
MKKELRHVEGHSSLVKDLSTGAILNTNKEEIQRAREMKKRVIAKREKEKAMQEDIADLKKEFSELKDLIKTMIEKH